MGTEAKVKVFGPARSTCVARVLVCLEEVGAEYELVNVHLPAGEHKGPAHLTRSPFGQVPAFQDGDLILFGTNSPSNKNSDPHKQRRQEEKQRKNNRCAAGRHTLSRATPRLPIPRPPPPPPSPAMHAAATAPALVPPILLPLCLPTGAGSSARPRRAGRAAVRCELAAASSAAPAAAPRWAQRTVVIPPQRRGCHIITHKIMHAIRSDLSEFKCGLAHLFLHHTSASLTLNENYDPDVQTDTETFLSRIVPEGPSAPWRHTIEGSDDMPAHIKSSMFGCALTIPITDGRLNMGTWQGIWLCEHRDYATPRTIVITLSGI
ncbi:hypothetical protein ACQJBY_039784 [Aegilops geniculata]